MVRIVVHVVVRVVVRVVVHLHKRIFDMFLSVSLY